MTFEYFPSGVCSMKINIDVDEETKIVNEIKFIGGCAGNTQGVASLVKGMHIDEVISRLKGIDCRGRGTSCPDQLSKALEELNKQIVK
ncbi:MAG: TIGR03905 family TSCPD domain-containing protein [Clostridia bacterium]|nr:TIGR03905 family TSCPD domain-containing protein [Clostridia bacterium]